MSGSLDAHRLVCGDALDAGVVALLMQGERVRMVFSDPPYNVPIDGHAGNSGKVRHREFAMAAGEVSAAEFTGFLRTAFRTMADHSLDGAIHFPLHGLAAHCGDAGGRRRGSMPS